MGVTGLVIALLLPWALGCVWVSLLWKKSGNRSRSRLVDSLFVLGYGYPSGIIMVTIIMRSASYFDIRLDFLPLSLFIGACISVAAYLHWSIPNRSTHPNYCRSNSPHTWEKIVTLVLLSLLFVRFGNMFMEIVWRPLFPWDAWMHYAPKAIVWSEWHDLIPVVSHVEWINNPNKLQYTFGSSSKLPTLSLIHTWHALGLGYWDQSLLNIPWWLCSISLGFAFYSQSRIYGVNHIAAMIFTYLLLSIPYTNVNVILAGYAEIWVATVYVMVIMAFFNWIKHREIKQAIVALFFALLCTQTKLPGVMWVLMLIPAFISVILPTRVFVALAVSIPLVLFITFINIELLYEVTGRHSLIISKELIQLPYLGPISYHSIVWSKIVENLFISSSWHLLWFLSMLLSIRYLFVKRTPNFIIMPTIILLLTYFSFLVIVYVFSDRYLWVVDSTQFNRAIFHITPALIFIMLTSFSHYNYSTPTHGTSHGDH